MSAPPVTLDFSKAQPVAATQPVSLDFANAKPITDTQSTPQQDLSHTLQNMTAAMSGQPQATPADQAQFDAGKQSGTEHAAVDTALGVAGGLGLPKAMAGVDSALKYLGFGAKAAKEGQVATGLLDQYGSPIMKNVEEEAKPFLQQILSHDNVQKALKVAGQEALKGAIYSTGGIGAYKYIHMLFGKD